MLAVRMVRLTCFAHTIKLDDKSSESLQHLEFVNAQMGARGNTEDANTKVNSFTHDLDEAKDIFSSGR